MQQLTQKQIDNFLSFLNSHKAFVICGHKEPDGDCVASSLGIAELLKKLNKPFSLLNAGPFKRPEIKKFEKQFSAQFMRQTTNLKETGLIMVDCSESYRLGDLEQSLKNLDTFIVDHHKSATFDENFAIIDTTAPAAACIVQQLYEKLVGKLDKEIAKTLFFGFATDSGFFRFLNENSQDVFLATSRLVEAGANPRDTYDEITGGKPYNSRKLLGTALQHAESFFENKLIITYETIEDTKNYGSEGRDSDALYSLLLAVEGVKAVVFIRQETASSCTIGFRSRNDVDVSLIAAKFDGGGHKNASGACTQGTIDTLLPKIKKEFEKIL